MMKKYLIIIKISIILFNCQSLDNSIKSNEAKELYNKAMLSEIDDDKLMLLNQAIDIYPEYNDAIIEKAIVYMDKLDFKKSLEELNKSLKINAINQTVLTLKADIYKRQGYLKLSREFYNKALKVSKTYSNAYSGLSDIFFKTRDYFKSLENINIAIQLNPNKVSYYLDRAMIYLTQSDFKNALNSCNIAIELDSLNHDSYLLKALIYAYSGDYIKSDIELNNAIEYGVEIKYTYEILGFIEFQNENYLKSLEYIKMSINEIENDYKKNIITEYEYNIKLIQKHRFLIFIYHSLNDYEMSKLYYKKSIESVFLKEDRKFKSYDFLSKKEQNIYIDIHKSIEYFEQELVPTLDLELYKYRFQYYTDNNKKMIENELILKDISKEKIKELESKLIEKLALNEIIPGVTSIPELLQQIGNPSKLYIHKTIPDNSYLYRFYYGELKITIFNDKIVDYIRFDDPIIENLNYNIISKNSNLLLMYNVLKDSNRINNFEELKWENVIDSVTNKKENHCIIEYENQKIILVEVDKIIKYIFFVYNR